MIKLLLILSLLASTLLADNYIVVTGWTMNGRDFESEVNGKIKQGYELVGGVAILNETRFVQAMVKKDKK